MKLKIKRECKNKQSDKSFKTAQNLLMKNYIKLLSQMQNKQPLSIKEIYTIGSRQGGKTFSHLDFMALSTLLKNTKTICYIFRLNDKMLRETRKDIFNHFEMLGIECKQGTGGNYNAADNILTIGENRVIFKTLNHEKIKISSGGAAGLETHNDADYIITFFDEATTLNEKLVSQVSQSIRGGSKTQKLFIYAANPGSPENGYVKKCLKYLPENENELLQNGYQERLFFDEATKANIYILRNNVLTNPYLSETEFNKLNAGKSEDENGWKIVFLGCAGTIGNTIYAHNLKKMQKVDGDFINKGVGIFQGGVDGGDGSSAGASPTTCHFGKISLADGCQVIAEKTIGNNKGVKHTTEEQIAEVIKFYKEAYLTYKTPFKVFIDNAALSDFYEMFNSALPDFGLTVNEIEFVPCGKSPIEKRIAITNLMICKGWFRLDKEACPDLGMALNNAHGVEMKEEREGFKRVRNHDETHGINSGAEYILDHYLDNFAEKVGYKQH